MTREIDEAWVETAIERYRRIQSLQEEFDRALHTVQVTIRSPDNLVEVVVSAAGEIRQVTVLGAVHGRTAQELSKAVESAVTAAGSAARWARRRLHAETFGGYPPLGES